MDKMCFFFFLIMSITLNAQVENFLYVDYVYTNKRYSNSEILIANSQKSFYVKSPLNLTFDVEQYEEDGELNFIIPTKEINLKGSTYYSELRKPEIILNIKSSNNSKIIVKDILPEWNWKLVEGTKTIGDYKCSKATIEFRGRNYEAYYTSEIPLAYGPYKFRGLPGVILQISSVGGDLENFFSWTAQEIKFPVSITYDDLPAIIQDNPQSLKEYVISYDNSIVARQKASQSRLPKDIKVERSTIKRTGIELIYEWELENEKN